jgi:hypothetical protein
MTPDIHQKLFTQSIRGWLNQYLRPLEATELIQELLEWSEGPLPLGVAGLKDSLDDQIEEWHARHDGWITGEELRRKMTSDTDEAFPVEVFNLIRRANGYGVNASMPRCSVEVGPFLPEWAKQGYIPFADWSLIATEESSPTVTFLKFMTDHGRLVVRGLCEEWCGPGTKLNLEGDEWHFLGDWRELNDACGLSSHREGGSFPVSWQLLTGDSGAAIRLREAGELVATVPFTRTELILWGRFTDTYRTEDLEKDPAVIAAVTRILENE